jgi:hypothetical protein
MGKNLQKLTCVLDVRHTKKLNARKVHVFFTRHTATQKHKNAKQRPSPSADHGIVNSLLSLE